MFELIKLSSGTYLLPKTGKMKVPGLVIATDRLLQEVEIDKPIIQVQNVAQLPGIVGYSIAMPDIHWGYGFPIGGVAAMDIESGVISPGGVGYDINCGVRLALVPIEFDSLSEKVKDNLIKTIYEEVPSGVGSHHKNIRGLSDRDYEELISQGALWSVKQGIGLQSDIDHTESLGYIEGADMSHISFHAKERGRRQLGSVGSGNHFIEIGNIDQIMLPEIAKTWNVSLKQTYILIHSGSRGFGHQVCQDTLNVFVRKGYAQDLPDKQLVAAPIQSDDGKCYFSAMAAAANFAFNNRQQILHLVRGAFKQVLNIQPDEIRQLYDVCHNMAKFEEHEVDGKLKKLCVHRKGATRAFGPNAKELAALFKKTGQPVLVPGDMGRASYLLAGLGNPLTWASSCHGAGRSKSRTESFHEWKGKDTFSFMEKAGVKVLAASKGTVAEEMPDAYKDVNEVVLAVQEAKLASIVAKLKPHLVVKG